jgi:hypothetical protein
MNWLQFTVASLALVCFASFGVGAFTVFDRVGDPGPDYWPSQSGRPSAP